MKTSHLLNILLAVALVILSVKIVYTGNNDDMNNEVTAQQDQNTALENILTRSSVRAYTDQAISDAQIDTLMRAAMSAPTAVNKQPWQFLVITDRAILDSIASNFKNIHMAQHAPLAIVVCGDLDKALEGDAQSYWIQDCSAATENILLAAHGMGLGAVWCGIYPIQQRVDLLRDMLSIPSNLIPLNVIPVGYPKAPQNPKDKYDAARIHTNSFQ